MNAKSIPGSLLFFVVKRSPKSQMINNFKYMDSNGTKAGRLQSTENSGYFEHFFEFLVY